MILLVAGLLLAFLPFLLFLAPIVVWAVWPSIALLAAVYGLHAIQRRRHVSGLAPRAQGAARRAAPAQADRALVALGQRAEHARRVHLRRRGGRARRQGRAAARIPGR